MTEQIPVVDFRFGDKWFITDFITPFNPSIMEIAEAFPKTDDTVILDVAEYIRDSYSYPFNSMGEPACNSQLCNAEFFPNFPAFQYSIFRMYAWDFPAETVITKSGYCAETAHLMCSILRNRGLNAYVCLGAVLNPVGEVLGYHAWVKCMLKGQWYVCETTIHEPNIQNLIPMGDLYTGRLDVTYREDCYYNESEFRGEYFED